LATQLLDPKIRERASIRLALPVWFWMALVAFAIRLAVIPFVYDEWLNPYNLLHFEPANVARALLAGHGFGSPFLSDQPSAIMSPVYPLVLSAIFSIFGIQTAASVFAMLGLNSLFSALACIPIFLVARENFGSRTGHLAGWGWAFFPYGVYFSAEWAWSTHLLLLVLCWMIYLALQLEGSRQLRLWAGFGLLAGFAALIEPVAIPVFGILLAMAVRSLWLERIRWFAPAMIAVLCFASFTAPWAVRNTLVMHRFVPVRSGMGLEMFLGNTGNNLHWRSGANHPNHNPAELAEYNRDGEMAFMDHKMAQAKIYIAEHPGWYVKMCVRRFAYMWTGYWSFDPKYLAEEPLDLANIPVATTITLLALIGLVLSWRFHRDETLRYGLILLAFPMVYYLVHPETYYLRPIDPILVILGSYTLVRIEQKIRLGLRGKDALPEQKKVFSYAERILAPACVQVPDRGKLYPLN